MNIIFRLVKMILLLNVVYYVKIIVYLCFIIGDCLISWEVCFFCLLRGFRVFVLGDYLVGGSIVRIVIFLVVFSKGSRFWCKL